MRLLIDECLPRAFLLLVSRSNQIEDLAPIVPAALTALETILPGQVVRIGA